MTRFWSLVFAATAVVLAGCSPGSTSSGSSSSTARVGDCYVAVSDPPVDCNQRHIAQTVLVVSRHPPTDPTRAMAPCREAQAHFLGQDFNTRLDLQLWVAQDKSWYRCDVLLRNSTYGSTGYQTLTGSLRDVLHEGVNVDLQACLGTPYDPTADQPYVPCQQAHAAQELVVAPAIGTLAEPFPTDIGDRAASACNAAASAQGLLSRRRTVTAYFPRNARAWASGERTADCWVTANSGTLPPAPRQAR